MCKPPDLSSMLVKSGKWRLVYANQLKMPCQLLSKAISKASYSKSKDFYILYEGRILSMISKHFSHLPALCLSNSIHLGVN